MARLGRIDPKGIPSKERTERRRSAEKLIEKRQQQW